MVSKALADPSDRVRCVAIRALYDWGEGVPIAEAMAWLPAQGASRSLALSALTKLADPDTAAVLATSLLHGTAQPGLWEEEANTVSALCTGGGRHSALAQVLDLLVEGLDYKDEEVAGRAEDFLLWLGTDAERAVKAAVRHSSTPHRAVRLLGQIGGAAAINPLIEALDHADVRTRGEACVALGELRDPISVDALLQATHDTEHDVRVKAAAAINRIGTVALVAALSKPNPVAAVPLRPLPAANGSVVKPRKRSSSRA